MKPIRTPNSPSSLALVAIASSAVLALAGCLHASETTPSATTLDAGSLVNAPDTDADAILGTGVVVTADAGTDASAPIPPDASDASDAAPSSATLGGTVSGLVGSGLVLATAAGDTVSIAHDGAFAFASPLTPGSGYTISVAQQPSSPWQTCAVANAMGVATGDVTNLVVTCVTNTYAVGGTVTGLAGSGLVLTSALPGGGTDTATVNQNGAFVFPTKVPSGADFAVSVETNPASPAQVCTASGATGTVAHADVTSVVVNCSTSAFTIGGTVSGLAGNGLALSNGTDTASVSANGTFAFPTPVASGGAYQVAVKTQPTSPSQTCTVTGGSGKVAATPVTNVAVACTTRSFAIGGTVSGLAGSGLVLHDGAGGSLPVASNGAFTFAGAVASGAAYAVTVATQPTAPSQTCTVTSGSGTVGNGPVQNVSIACATNTYAVSGTVSGLAGSGLTLTLDGANPIAVTGSSFAFTAKVASGASYVVAVKAQPQSPSETCTVTRGSGTIAGSDVSDVAVTCDANTFTVGGTISGLTGSGLVLTDDAGNATTVAAGATSFTFSQPVVSGAAYDVEVRSNPSGPTQTCTASGNEGTMGNGNVTSVVVNCALDSFTVSGTVSGLVGGGFRLGDGASTIAVASDGSFAFPPLPSGSSYDVEPTAFPTSPWQTCTVANASGTITSAPVTDVAVTCTTVTMPVVVTVNANHVNPGLVITDSSSGTGVTIFGAGTFTLENLVSGASFALSLTTPQAGQPCSLSGSTQGTVADSAIYATVTCTDVYPVTLVVTGGSGCTYINFFDGVDSLPVTAGGTGGTFADYRYVGQGTQIGFSTTDPSQCICNTLWNSGTIWGPATMTTGGLTAQVTCSEPIQ